MPRTFLPTREILFPVKTADRISGLVENNVPKDDLPLLVGIERLDQLPKVFIPQKPRGSKREIYPKRYILDGWQPKNHTHKN